MRGLVAACGLLLWTAAAQAADIPARTWVLLPLPGSGVGISNHDKHVSLAMNPDTGRIYFTGGDYLGQSYRQETWSLDVATRLASTNPATGWTLEYPYCGPSTQVQPKGPDFVGWTWDTLRHVFWMVPGVMETHGGVSVPLCPGETTGWTSDGRFLFQRMMQFNPATKLWADYDAWPPHVGPAGTTNQNTWAAVYDSKTDTIVHAANGYSMGVYTITTKTWTQYPYGNPNGPDPEIATHQWAADLAGRRIFMVDSRWQALYQWDMDGRRFVGTPLPWMGAGAQPVIGMSPCPPLPTSTVYIDKGYLVWDSNAKVMIHVCYNRTGAWAYLPDAIPPRWEDLSALPVQGTQSSPQMNGLTFDPVRNWLVGLGWDGIWLFRYSAAVVVPVPTPPAVRPTITITIQAPVGWTIPPVVTP